MHRRGYTTQLWVSTRGAEPTRFSNTPNLIGERTSNFVTRSVGGEFSDLAFLQMSSDAFRGNR